MENISDLAHYTGKALKEVLLLDRSHIPGDMTYRMFKALIEEKSEDMSLFDKLTENVNKGTLLMYAALADILTITPSAWYLYEASQGRFHNDMNTMSIIYTAHATRRLFGYAEEHSMNEVISPKLPTPIMSLG